MSTALPSHAVIGKKKKCPRFAPAGKTSTYFPLVDRCHNQGKNHLISTLDSFSVSVGIPPGMGISLPHTAVPPFSDSFGHCPVTPCLVSLSYCPCPGLPARCPPASGVVPSLLPQVPTSSSFYIQDAVSRPLKGLGTGGLFFHCLENCTAQSRCASLSGQKHALNSIWPCLVKLLWFLVMETNSDWLRKNQAKQKSNPGAHAAVPV